MDTSNKTGKEAPIGGHSPEPVVYRSTSKTVQARTLPKESSSFSDDKSSFIDKIRLPRFQSKRMQQFSGFFGVLQLLGAALLLALVINQFIFQSYQVFGESMEPTLHPGDRLIVSKLGKSWSNIRGHDFVPKRGEVIVFDSPNNSSQQLVKRVVGLPGETVEVKDGHITVYNIDNPDGFNPDDSIAADIADYTLGDSSLTLSSNQLFVVGDNRNPNASLDSRNELGPVPLENVIGTLIMRIFPLSDAAFY